MKTSRCASFCLGLGVSLSLATPVALAGPIVPGDAVADLIYDPATGNVRLQPDALITNFTLTNAAGGQDFVGTPASVTFPEAHFTNTATPVEVSYTDLDAGGFTTLQNLGNFMPAGLTTESAVQSFLTQRSYVGAIGSGVREFNVALAPEPGTLALLGFALVPLLAQRRRRA